MGTPIQLGGVCPSRPRPSGRTSSMRDPWYAVWARYADGILAGLHGLHSSEPAAGRAMPSSTAASTGTPRRSRSATLCARRAGRVSNVDCNDESADTSLWLHSSLSTHQRWVAPPPQRAARRGTRRAPPWGRRCGWPIIYIYIYREREREIDG